MPFYEYECSACQFYVEALQKISEPPLRECPSCKEPALTRLISAPVFRLKGGGWYETDFKSDGEAKRNLAAREDGAAQKSDSTASDSKPAAEQTAKADPKPAAAKSEGTEPKKSAAEKPAAKAAEKPQPKPKSEAKAAGAA